MAQPSQQEIISYIRQVAAQYGIDPNVMLRIIKQESGFNPAARGDAGHSVGLAQLFDAGLQQDFRQQMGVDPADPANWKQHIDFMARHASQTKGKIGGWNPWHGARDIGIAQYEGLGGPAPGRKGVAGEVAQSATPMTPPPFAQPGDPYNPQTAAGGGSGQMNMADFFKEWQAAQEPPQQTLAGLLLGGKKNQTLAGMAFEGFKDKGQEELAKEAETTNPFAPMTAKQQIAAKKKTQQQTLAGALMGRKPAAAPAQSQGPTLFSALVGAKKADAAAGLNTPNSTLLGMLFGKGIA